MPRLALTAGLAALLLAGAAFAETKPPEKPGAAPKTPPKASEKPAAKPDAKAAGKVNRVTYACDGGVTLTVTYPPEAQAKTRPVKVATKETTYFVRPGKDAAAGKYENATIKLVFQVKGEEASLEREGKALAEKCKPTKSGT